jgi:branched-chain amino acid transport system substrate-binding protein
MRLREADLTLALRSGYAPQAPPAEMTAAARRLRAAECQVLLHCGRGTDAVALFRALREEGWRPRVVLGLGGGYGLADTAQAIGPEIEGTLLADLPQPRVEERFAPGAAAFAEAYRRRYGAEMRSGHSLACYSGAQVAFEAAQRAGGAAAADPARFRAAMQATDLPAGALPNGWGARFDERGQNARARTVLMQWREGGRLVAVMPAEAAVAPLVVRGG